MLRLPIFVASLGLFVCSSANGQPELDKKTQAFEKNLSDHQKRLFHEYVDLNVRQHVRGYDPASEIPPRNLPEIRRDLLTSAAAMSPAKAKIFWRDLPHVLRRGFRDLDPLHVTDEERKASKDVPADVKKAIANLLSDDLDEVLAARRKIIAHGPTCRALVVAQLLTLKSDAAKRVRHQEVLAKLDLEETHDRRMRITEVALRKASKLEKSTKDSNSTIAVLVARNLCDGGNRQDPYARMCYYNFLSKDHAYKTGVALGFGNGAGNPLDVNFYGGQDSRFMDLGAVDYASVKKAPGPDTTAKWSKGDNGRPPAAVAGHVYLLHVLDPHDMVDFTLKLKVREISSEEWIIVEWERIPQEP